MRTFQVIALSASLLGACAPPAPTAQTDARALAEGEMQVVGQVTQVEDGGYPRFTIHVQPAGGEPIQLYLDAESGVDLGGRNAGDFVGGRATIYYITSEELDLLEVTNAAGASIMHEDGQAAPTHADTMTGTLSNAQVTSGDLPDVVTITAAQGAAREFEYFVDDQFAAANGQQVTAYYHAGTREEITLMRAAPAER